MPRFAFEYLEGGCNSEVNLRRNTEEIRQVQLKPWYLRDYAGSDLRTELFGKTYDAPFGISPIGLQGLMWPRATEILAEAGVDIYSRAFWQGGFDAIARMVDQLEALAA